ncbi:MAG: YbhB/YbcL family Raf kinase inhibitor-like protein [Bacteroidota bacterium]|nr:YbhB/YbcL family Raf kinase inhibitor-like protein [Bacteroidota bacterium]MDP4216641.1 YbhB/YbcL family Raf kinase inhibitor-like protein [Bacteroidota bacterium]MDP4245742.1 YbhB/YbcL family Raf kinase inhibitor-like protein [Bacteroidota bacterium]MDP4255174.1 YbhB/YbcL family Raf kinase inhibitor-like protein [Bacteroidota bacterium]MDP4260704.1 YbhB/YbcL family Raf kinase inhibitor-like protein [Bacteroidota bacterium]
MCALSRTRRGHSQQQLKAEAESLVSLTPNCVGLRITSPVFDDHGSLPVQYTCDGANISPSLNIDLLPSATKSLALVMDDIDAPDGHFFHWLAWNIPVVKHLPEARTMEAEGENDFHVTGYKGPCPPFGTHKYLIHLYALDSLPDLPPKSQAAELLQAIRGHILGYGHITTLYKRK